MPNFRDPKIRGYLIAAGSVAVAVLVRLTLTPLLGERSPFLAFTLAVAVSAGYGGLGPGLFATAASALLGTALFLPPAFTFESLNLGDAVQGVLFVVIGATISRLNEALRGARRAAVSSAAERGRSEEQFRLLVEGVRDYAIYMLDSGGRVVTWNAGAEHVEGYRADEVLGAHVSTFYTPEDVARDGPQRHLDAAIEREVSHDEGWRVRKDGSWFLADVTTTVLRDQAGVVRGFSEITRDVTERRRAQEEVRRLNETLEQRVQERTRQLEEANAELEAFSYSVSHDLRAPLRAAQGFAHALLEDYGERLDATGHSYCRRIAAAAARMDGLIQDLLAYGRLSRADLELRPVPLEAAVAEARSSLEEEIGGRGAEVRVDGPLPQVLANGPALTQVVTNLISNAVKFVAAGERPRVHVHAERRDGVARLWVEDNGIGVEEPHRDRIFRVFERLHGADSYPGTGIGLAIVKKGVERMGGRAGVESSPGEGSRFWIELPVAGDGR